MVVVVLSICSFLDYKNYAHEERASSDVLVLSVVHLSSQASPGLMYAEVGSHVRPAAVMPPASDENVRYTLIQSRTKDPAGMSSLNQNSNSSSSHEYLVEYLLALLSDRSATMVSLFLCRVSYQPKIRQVCPLWTSTQIPAQIMVTTYIILLANPRHPGHIVYGIIVCVYQSSIIRHHDYLVCRKEAT